MLEYFFGASDARAGGGGDRSKKEPEISSLRSWALACAIRTLGASLRIQVHDLADISAHPPESPVLWVMWHNRVLIAPYLWMRFCPHRSSVVLTSASRDGDLISQTMARFGVDSIRGSTSRKSKSALVNMVRAIQSGLDIVITPDGPRGPRYCLQPGVIKVAQITGAKIIPVHMQFTRAWTLKTWDRFCIPWPFSRTIIIFDELVEISDDPQTDMIETERRSLEEVMRKGTHEPDALTDPANPGI